MSKEKKSKSKSKKKTKKSVNITERRECPCCDGKGVIIDYPKNIFQEPLRTICPCCKGLG